MCVGVDTRIICNSPAVPNREDHCLDKANLRLACTSRIAERDIRTEIGTRNQNEVDSRGISTAEHPERLVRIHVCTTRPARGGVYENEGRQGSGIDGVCTSVRADDQDDQCTVGAAARRRGYGQITYRCTGVQHGQMGHVGVMKGIKLRWTGSIKGVTGTRQMHSSVQRQKSRWYTVRCASGRCCQG